MTNISRITKYQGFTLIELMVSMLIGLILLAGVSSVFVSSKKSYTANDSLARLQENARISLQILTRTLRSTGYYGCADDIQTYTSSLNDEAEFEFRAGARLEGATKLSGATTWFPSAATADIPALVDTDMITTRFLDGSTTITMLGDMNQNSAQMQINEDSGVKAGDIMMLTDCSSADIFQVTGLNNNGGFDHIIHNTGSTEPGNKTNRISKAYSGEAKLMKFRTVIFYIGESNTSNKEPSLFRQTLETNASGKAKMVTQELVQGVEDFKIRYGVTTNNDRVPNIYVDAEGVGTANNTITVKENWNNVITMRIGIVVRSQANLTTSDKKAVTKDLDSAKYDVDGDGEKEYDMSTDTRTTNGVPWRAYDRRVFRTTILLRNLQ